MHYLSRFIRIIIFSPWLSISCHSTVIFQQIRTLPNSTWPRLEQQAFTFSFPDSQGPYSIQLLLTNTPNYLYQNIYIVYELRDATGALLKHELVDYNLFDPVTGEPLAKGYGSVQKNTFTLESCHIFPTTGPYTLVLTQYMRPEQLPGIHQVGIKISSTHSKGIAT